MRLASLVPSGTDLIASLGLAEHLVGVSHECDHPSAVGLPVLTRSRVPSAPDRPAAEVDAAVSAAMADGGPLYLTDRALLAELAPDVVLTQDICDVCAVRGRDADAALPKGATLVTLSATSVAGLAADLRAVGEAVGVDGAAAARRWLAEVDAVEPTAEPMGVLTLEWSDPPFLGGHWVPELVERAGGTNVLAQAGGPSRRATPEELQDADADVVLFLPCGYDLEAAAREAESLPAWGRSASLWACDANRLFSRCTPAALLGGLRLIAAVLREEPVDPADAVLVR